MKKNKYSKSDKKCCEWLDTLMDSNVITVEEKELIPLIKRFLIECPPEELDPIRGKYLAFVKNESNKYQLYDYVLNDGLESNVLGLKNAFLFFIPTEHSYCNTASMPYRNAIMHKPKRCGCIMS